MCSGAPRSEAKSADVRSLRFIENLLTAIEFLQQEFLIEDLFQVMKTESKNKMKISGRKFEKNDCAPLKISPLQIAKDFSLKNLVNRSS